MNVWELSASKVLTDFVYDKPIEITYNMINMVILVNTLCVQIAR